MFLDLLTTVVLQRIYIAGSVSVTLFTHLLFVALLLVRGRLVISPVRVILFWLLWGTAVAMQMVAGTAPSYLSTLLGVICYAGFLGVVPANRQTYFAFIAGFQKVSMAVAILVFLDIALQLAGLGQPDMNTILPASMIPPAMNYLQPAVWGASLMKPNAFFMMEASFTSQFIAIGLIIEMAFFRRWLWLVGFSLALIGTISGTGLMLVILALPVLIRRVWRSILVYSVILLPLLGGLAVETGWYEIAVKRAGTFDTSGSSANSRFVEPFEAMYELAQSGSGARIFYGLGAGTLAGSMQTPGLVLAEYHAMSKMFLEYGVVVFALFMVFTTYCLFFTGAPLVIAYAAAIEYHFMGGYLLIPNILNYCYVLTAGWSIQGAMSPARSRLSDPAGRRAGSSPAADIARPSVTLHRA